MSLGLPADIDADVGAIESGADQLDAVCRNMLGQSEGTHSRFQSSAGEFTDLVAWNIVSGSSKELASWQEAAASLTYGAAVLRRWGLDIETYRAERAKLETRWEEARSDAQAAVDASEGSGSILGEGTREGLETTRLETLREELLAEHSRHWETLMEHAEQAGKDLRDGPGQDSLERLIESSLLSGSQLAYFGDAVPSMVPGELSGDEHPSVVNLWWTSMTEEEQERAVRDHPGLLRELDGIPAAVRDRLNRDHLDGEIERFEEMIAERDEEIRDMAARGSNGSAAIALSMSADDTLDNQLTELKELRDSLEDENNDRYLLALDTGGDGRAIVANGNPDTADNVATLVPGTTTTWESINDQVGRGDNLVESATTADPDGDHSVISWIGYDAPSVLEAAFEGRAEGAVAELSSFQEGLRATHQGQPSNNTVIGHSYGTTVVGHTAQSGAGLDADSVVLVGSPGVNTDHAAYLNLPAENVHVSTAANDGITHLTGFTHGMDPTDPEFGANEFESNAGGVGGSWPLGPAHSEYFDPRTKSLLHMGRVIAGQTE
jgi:hypothetical protein